MYLHPVIQCSPPVSSVIRGKSGRSRSPAVRTLYILVYTRFKSCICTRSVQAGLIAVSLLTMDRHATKGRTTGRAGAVFIDAESGSAYPVMRAVISDCPLCRRSPLDGRQLFFCQLHQVINLNSITPCIWTRSCLYKRLRQHAGRPARQCADLIEGRKVGSMEWLQRRYIGCGY